MIALTTNRNRVHSARAQVWDLLVVGAGVAGCALAHTLGKVIQPQAALACRCVLCVDCSQRFTSGLLQCGGLLSSELHCPSKHMSSRKTGLSQPRQPFAGTISKCHWRCGTLYACNTASKRVLLSVAHSTKHCQSLPGRLVESVLCGEESRRIVPRSATVWGAPGGAAGSGGGAGPVAAGPHRGGAAAARRLRGAAEFGPPPVLRRHRRAEGSPAQSPLRPCVAPLHLISRLRRRC